MTWGVSCSSGDPSHPEGVRNTPEVSPEDLAEADEPPTKPGLDGTQRQVHCFRDPFVRKAVVERKPKNLFLVGIQSLESFGGLSYVVTQFCWISRGGAGLEKPVVLEMNSATGLGPALTVDQPSMSDCGNKRGLGALGRVKSAGVSPNLNEDFLDRIFQVLTVPLKVSLCKAPDRAAVFIQARRYRGRVSGGDSGKERLHGSAQTVRGKGTPSSTRGLVGSFALGCSRDS